MVRWVGTMHMVSGGAREGLLKEICRMGLEGLAGGEKRVTSKVGQRIGPQKLAGRREMSHRTILCSSRIRAWARRIGLGWWAGGGCYSYSLLGMGGRQ